MLHFTPDSAVLVLVEAEAQAELPHQLDQELVAFGRIDGGVKHRCKVIGPQLAARSPPVPKAPEPRGGQQGAQSLALGSGFWK
jgi:hypothetical protein